MASTATTLPTSPEIMLDPIDTLSEQSRRSIPMSYEDYLTWRGSQRHSEWVDGEALVLMPSSFVHAALVTFLTTLLRLYVDQLRLGVVVTAPFEMRLSDLNVAREPDILFVAMANLQRIEFARINGPADLAVEVISKDSVGRDKGDKFDEYDQAGVGEYWIADPRPGRQRFEAWARGDGESLQLILPDADGRIHSTVIPGFWLHPDWLWEDPLRIDLARLNEILDTSLPSGQSDVAHE